MIRYSDENWMELVFTGFEYEVERRNDQWVDVSIRVETAEHTPLPMDLIDFSILVVCTHHGHPIELSTQDEEMDCEYQLTEGEKQQINAFIRSNEVQEAIAKAANAG
jgi:hypothetical protein